MNEYREVSLAETIDTRHGLDDHHAITRVWAALELTEEQIAEMRDVSEWAARLRERVERLEKAADRFLELVWPTSRPGADKVNLTLPNIH